MLLIFYSALIFIFCLMTPVHRRNMSKEQKYIYLSVVYNPNITHTRKLIQLFLFSLLLFLFIICTYLLYIFFLGSICWNNLILKILFYPPKFPNDNSSPFGCSWPSQLLKSPIGGRHWETLLYKFVTQNVDLIRAETLYLVDKYIYS